MSAKSAISALGNVFTLGALGSYEAKVEAEKQEKQKKAELKAREAELAREAAAKEAAKKKAESAGQRAGFGAGAGGGASTRSTFVGSARPRGQGGTGFSNVSEDNIGRATLFGN
jgi:membrane protein involved in colicin uptake